MIPVRLYLRNFMSYGDPGTEVDFDFHIACLSGNNGEGKSALLDAVTWALWGIARGVAGTGAGSEDLIHADGGADEAQVELTFRLGEDLYRVTRRRHRRRGGGVALERWDEEHNSFRPLTSVTQRDTQAVINRLLHMEYETFINSAFLLQGRADEFTRRTPRERKEILAEILDLKRYDELAQRARDRGRETRGQASQHAAEVERLRPEVARQAEHRAEVERWEQAARQAAEQLAAAEAAAEEARKGVAALEAQQTRLADLERDLSSVEREREALGKQVEALRARVAASRAVVERREEILAGAAELARLRAEEAVLSQKAQQVAALLRRRDAAVARIEAEGKRLDHTIAEKRREAEARATQAREAGRFERELAAAREALAAAEQAQRQMEALREEAQTRQAERAAAQADVARAHSAADETSRKAGLLEGADVRCPVCRQTLDASDRAQVLAHLAQEREQVEKAERESRRVADAAAEALAALRGRMDALRPQVDSVPRTAHQIGAIAGRLERAQQAAQEAQALHAELEGLRRQAEAGEFAPEARRERAQAEAEIAAIGYETASHQSARERIERLAGFERERGQLEQAEATLQGNDETLAEMAGSVHEKGVRARLLTKQIGTVRIELSRLGQALQQAEEAAMAVIEARKAHTAAEARAGVSRERLERCQALARELAERRQAGKQAERDAVAFGALAEAFGRNGIQALIIESVVPQLADYANELLGRLSDGRMQVSFLTQKRTAKGEAAETLDIMIRDGDSARKYELYSGGEAFRANFAIRVALSRLLAQRAGARLQTLVIDEGFGTQDAQGRDRLVEAILAIADEFERIIVVTHIEDLKDAFPHRIEVTKDESGSHVRQVAVA